MLRRGLIELGRLDFPRRSGSGLFEVSAVLVEMGEPELAARLLGTAELLIEELAVDLDPLALEVAERLAAELGDDSLASLRAEGRRLSLEEAVELALTSID